MIISCKNINDFCTLITTCALNNINDIRIFISHNESYPSLAFESTSKNNFKFVYVLFTPLYTAIYSGNVKNEPYDDIYKQLLECQEQCKHSFRIQVFEKLDFNHDNNNLIIEHELEVI